MIVAAALLLGAVLVSLFASTPLSALSGRASPSVELSWWLALGAAAATSTVIGAILLLLGDRPHVDGGPWQPCWAVLGHSSVHPLDELSGMLLLAMIFLTVAKVAKHVGRRLSALRRTHNAHLTAVQLRFVSHMDGVVWIDHDVPFAYSISGRPNLVVASTALNSLPPSQREAVLQHERHHLRLRHHWLVIATDAIAQAIPRVPLFRAAAAATRTLTEHSADEATARQMGTKAMAGALLAFGQSEQIALRLRRLQDRRPQSRPAGHIAAIAASSLMPVIVGGAVFGALITLAC